MGKLTGFLEYDRKERSARPTSERVKDYKEFILPISPQETQKQAARCMDCGVPYCHSACPVNNEIPDWNDLTYRESWKKANENLHFTNNFPEFTGRVCPAPCEAACTLNLENVPVAIKAVECAIADAAWENGWVNPQPPHALTGKRVAIIGSGPAGLAAGQQLARAGHAVTIYEKNSAPGGLLRYGIPDFKLEKKLIDRRITQMEAEGVVFRCDAPIAEHEALKSLLRDYDAILLATGSEVPRDLAVPGRDLKGVHFAMPFLTQQNRRNSGEALSAEEKPILAENKHVVVIGGGDTGSDCIGTCLRQNALSVTQLEIMPRPPEMENKLLSWPDWPLKLRTSSSHEEGAERMFSVATESFKGENGKVEEIACVRLSDKMEKIPGSTFTLKADLALLAMGFIHPIFDGLLSTLSLEKDPRGNIAANTDDYKTSQEKIFAAGDARRGQSLVVWAIREGRQAAQAIDAFLLGEKSPPAC